MEAKFFFERKELKRIHISQSPIIGNENGIKEFLIDSRPITMIVQNKLTYASCKNDWMRCDIKTFCINFKRKMEIDGPNAVVHTFKRNNDLHTVCVPLQVINITAKSCCLAIAGAKGKCTDFVFSVIQYLDWCPELLTSTKFGGWLLRKLI